jgi:hypothetical protein
MVEEVVPQLVYKVVPQQSADLAEAVVQKQGILRAQMLNQTRDLLEAIFQLTQAAAAVQVIKGMTAMMLLNLAMAEKGCHPP